jgi:hypothetical protein
VLFLELPEALNLKVEVAPAAKAPGVSDFPTIPRQAIPISVALGLF